MAVHASVKIPPYSTPRLNPSSRSCASTLALVSLQPSILLHLHVEPADSQQTLALACDKLVTLDALALRSEIFLLSVWGFIHLYILIAVSMALQKEYHFPYVTKQSPPLQNLSYSRYISETNSTRYLHPSPRFHSVFGQRPRHDCSVTTFGTLAVEFDRTSVRQS